MFVVAQVSSKKHQAIRIERGFQVRPGPAGFDDILALLKLKFPRLYGQSGLGGEQLGLHVVFIADK